jgi:flagellar hook-associated protein 3 FlgL
MRVTFRAIDESLDAINTAAEQFARAQEQVASGRRLRTASDDPVAALRAIDGRTEIGTIDAYSRSADTADARLSVLDGVLTALVDTLTEAQATAATARGSTADQATLDAIAAKLQGQRERTASFLNSTFRGTYLFSGSAAQTQPYVISGGAWAYQGNSAPVTVDVGSSRSATIAMDGRAIAQGADAANVLSAFDALIVAAQARDEAGLEAGMGALARTFDRAVRAQSQVGADQSGIQEGQETLTRFRVAAERRVSKDEDANMAKAISQMTQAQTAYEAALGAVGTASRVSLLDYLR